MDWIWLIVALLVGFAVGGAVAWTVVKRRYGDRESVVELRTELDRYKGKVTEHFVETADLVNTLTRNYKRVYDHLEAGAYDLVGEETLRRELDAPAEAPVMLEYLGQRRPEVSEEPYARSPAADVGVGSSAPNGPTPADSSAASSGRTSTAAASEAGADPSVRPKAAGAEASPMGDDAEVHDEAELSDADERTRSAG